MISKIFISIIFKGSTHLYGHHKEFYFRTLKTHKAFIFQYCISMKLSGVLAFIFVNTTKKFHYY